MNYSNSTHNGSHVDHDVAVVGCGPTGATLAILLAKSGVDVLVIDREPAIYDLPRAVHFDDETMRVFQTAGISDALNEKVRVNPGMRFVDDMGEVLLDWPRPEGIGRHGWHTSYRLHQPDLEVLLREALTQHSNCTLKLGNQLLELEQVDASVKLTYLDIASEQTKTCRVKFVVGCDGANSLVRSLMSIDMEDLGFKERWLVVDVLLNSQMPQLGDHTVQYCSDKQPMTYCRNPGQRRRWEMALPADLNDDQALDSQRIWSVLARWIQPHQAQLERKAIYTFRSQLANRWRDKRALIAGDAAHLTPPFMGQGMCAGIRDASNLAWKLAMCVHGRCENELLDSYQQERRSHVREYITTAIRLGRLMNSLDNSSANSLTSGGTSSSMRMTSIAPKLGMSSLVPEQFGAVQHVGSMLDQPVLFGGVKLDEKCGYEPVLIIRDELLTNIEEERLEGVVVLPSNDDPALLTVLESLDVDAVLVRPDRYILATAIDAASASALNWRTLLSSRDPLSKTLN